MLSAPAGLGWGCITGGRIGSIRGGLSQGVIAGCTTGCSIGRVTERVERGSGWWHLLPVRTGHLLKDEGSLITINVNGAKKK